MVQYTARYLHLRLLESESKAMSPFRILRPCDSLIPAHSSDSRENATHHTFASVIGNMMARREGRIRERGGHTGSKLNLGKKWNEKLKKHFLKT